MMNVACRESQTLQGDASPAEGPAPQTLKRLGLVAMALLFGACTPALHGPDVEQELAKGNDSPIISESLSPLLTTLSDEQSPRAFFEAHPETPGGLDHFECQTVTAQGESAWFTCTSPLDLSLGSSGDDALSGRVRVRTVATDGNVGDYSEKPFRRGPVPRGVSGAVYSLLQSSLGGLYVGGSFRSIYAENAPGLVRLGPTGEMRFNVKTELGFAGGDVMTLLVAEPGASYYAAGSFTGFEGSDAKSLVKIFKDGSRDASFNIGSGFSALSGAVYVKALAAAGDGSGDLFAGGRFTSFNGTGANRLVRLNANGSRDTSFNMGSGFNNTVLALASAPNGDLYVGGAFTSYAGQSGVNRIVRLHGDGTLDTSFNFGTGFDAAVSLVAHARDGTRRVYVAGSFEHYQSESVPGLVRLNDDGSRDTTFNIGTGFNGNISAILALPSGRIAVAGSFDHIDGSSRRGIVVLAPDGSTYDDFDVGAGFVGDAMVLTEGPNESLWAGGNFISYHGTSFNGLVHITSNGQPDMSFDPRRGFNASPLALTMLGEDLLVGGGFGYYQGQNAASVVRLDSMGEPDSTFDSGEGFQGSVYALAEDSLEPSRVYVGGSFSAYNSSSVGRIVRLTATGRLDRSFSTGLGFNDTVQTVQSALDASGDVYVGGRFTSYDSHATAQVVRLNNDGSLDTSFATGVGFATLDISVKPVVYFVLPAHDGSNDIYVGGRFDTYQGLMAPGLVRLNHDGSRDASFNVGSGVLHALLSSAYVGALAEAPDNSGDIYVGGLFTHFNGVESPGLVRLKADGSINTSFRVGSGFDRASTHDAYVWTLKPVRVGNEYQIWVGGSFSSYQDESVQGFVLLDSSGARLNASSPIGEGTSGNVYAFSMSPNSGLVFGGSFRRAGSQLRLNLGRLRSPTELDESFHGQGR